MRCLHWGNDLSVRLLHFIRLLNTETREESLLQTSLCPHCSEHACYPGLNIRYNPDGQLNFKATRFPTRPGSETGTVSQKSIHPLRKDMILLQDLRHVNCCSLLGLASDCIAFC